MAKIKCVSTITIMILFLITGYGYAEENYEKCSKLKRRIGSDYSNCKKQCSDDANQFLSALKDFGSNLECSNGCDQQYPLYGDPMKSMSNMSLNMQCKNRCNNRTSNADNELSKLEACRNGCKEKEETALEQLQDMCD